MRWNKDDFLNKGGLRSTRQILLSLSQSIDSGEWNPYALAAKQYDDFNPSYEMAMNGPDRDGYIKAVQKELDALEGMNGWEVVD